MAYDIWPTSHDYLDRKKPPKTRLSLTLPQIFRSKQLGEDGQEPSNAGEEGFGLFNQRIPRGRWSEAPRFDLWKRCFLVFFLGCFLLGYRSHFIIVGIFVLWDLWWFMGSWSHLTLFWDILGCVWKLLWIMVWTNYGRRQQPIPRQISVQSNLSPANERLNLVRREIAVTTFNGVYPLVN